MSDELLVRVKAVVIDRLALDIAADRLDPAARLADAYGVDSVRLFDLVVGLEEDFGVSFEDWELKLDHFAAVNDIVARLQAKMDV